MEGTTRFPILCRESQRPRGLPAPDGAKFAPRAAMGSKIEGERTLAASCNPHGRRGQWVVNPREKRPATKKARREMSMDAG